ncbi:MAG: periplasmic heavy metal sensor [Pseudomonadota bacterium]
MNTEHQTRPGRGLKIALIASLGLNLLIIGAIVGLVSIGLDRRGGPGGPGIRAIGLGPILPALSSDDRQELGDRIRAGRGQLAEEARPLGQAVRGFATALRTEPFDRATAEAALQAQRTHSGALQAEGHALLLDQIETMEPAARAELADRIERGLRRTLERGHQWRQDERGGR